jgi:hypothetical protein
MFLLVLLRERQSLMCQKCTLCQRPFTPVLSVVNAFSTSPLLATVRDDQLPAIFASFLSSFFSVNRLTYHLVHYVIGNWLGNTCSFFKKDQGNHGFTIQQVIMWTFHVSEPTNTFSRRNKNPSPTLQMPDSHMYLRNRQLTS